ncbi:hypothetical protein J4233_05805 [Candidatus Pacearchaeota archaeon]|nr:hypothetical protein [uncultured archaeon]MBS3077751.1 hypothetical protein [Candidatus Pacearchaeota archaeon]
MASKRGPNARAKLPKSKVQADVGLTVERARALAEEMFPEADISNYVVTDVPSGAVVFSIEDGRKGYAFFAPNGTSYSGDPVARANIFAEGHKAIGRTVKREVDLTRNVVGIYWESDNEGRAHG